MRKIIIICTLVLLLGLSALAILKLRDTRTELEKAWFRQPVEQAATERIWKEVEFEKIVMVEEDLYNPLSVKLYGDENFLVSDYGDMTVKQFRFDGEPVAQFGKGEGRGPGEMLSMMDVKTDSSGRIWVLDDTNMRIMIFDSPDEWEMIELQQPVSRLVPVDSSRFIVRLRFSVNPEMRHADGGVLKEFEPIVRDPLLWSYIHDGFLENDPFGGIVRNFLYTHSFVHYTDDGEIDYFRRAIDPPSMEQIMRDIMEPIRYSEDQTLFFKEMSPFSRLPRLYYTKIIDNEIHALTAYATDEVRMTLPEGDIYSYERRHIDVYNVKTGDYLYSYKLPESITDFALSGNYFAGVSADPAGLIIWKISGIR